MVRFPQSLAFASLLSFYLLLPAVGDATTLAGQTVTGGGMVDIRFPVDKYFQDYAAEGGNPRPDTGRAVVMFPPGFDPARPWPILIVTSTTDAHRTSPMDANWYRRPATAEGWVVLASDATIKPREDSTSWRVGMLGAALEAIRKEWPQSASWPVAFGGLSGGAKRSGLIGVVMAKTGSIKVCGFFLSGINDDRLSPAYKTYQPGGDFLNVPIWLSGGVNDPIARPQDEEKVRASLVFNGFRRVRLEPFYGGHELKASEVQRALRWFREVGKF